MPRRAATPPSPPLMAIYLALGDLTRVRIVNLLLRGALCVGDFEEILGHPQAFISRHLAYLRGKGMVRAEKFERWQIYSLPKRRGRALAAQLKCLEECTREEAGFREDLERLREMAKRRKWVNEGVKLGRGRRKVEGSGVLRQTLSRKSSAARSIESLQSQ